MSLFLVKSFHTHTRKIISPWSEKQMLVMFTIMTHVRSCAVYLIGTSHSLQRPDPCDMQDGGCCQHLFTAAFAAVGPLPPGTVLTAGFWSYLCDLSVILKINVSTVLHE